MKQIIEWVVKKFKKKKVNSLIYLNQPISDTNSDWIGMSVYVNKIDEAIQKDAQMIAITSDYGGGKSSLIELLENKYKPSGKSKKKIFKISLWGFLNGNKKHVESKSINLHKSFLYQIGNNIDPKLGAYISRRLSKNFGLFKVGTSSPRFTLLVNILLFFVALGKGIDLFSDNILVHFKWTKGYLYPSTLLFYFVALLIGIFLFVRADIIFSTQKSENNRNIDENEIMDLYSTLIVKHRKLPFFKHCYKHYIIVLEDLDRTDVIDDVYIFLKELRKYYASDNMSKRKHKVTFIVNLKNEELLIGDNAKNEEIYQKIFDYTINLRPVNIDNYDVILKGLLQEKMDLITKLGLQIKMEDEIVKFPGMQWIIRSPHLNIREIKNMLNSAFLLYASLVDKFGADKITFEKCAIFAYLTNTYPAEFMKMKDRTFQDLIEKYISHRISDVNRLGEYLKETLGNEFSESYISDIHLLIENQLIDSTYRTYFYNYPRNSLLLDTNENLVYNTLLYNDNFDEAFNDQLLNVHISNPKLIVNALEKVKSLSINFPKVVLNNEIVFMEAISHFSKELMDLIAIDLKFDPSEIARTIESLKRILHYDSDRKYYNENFAKKLCDIIENQCSENLLYQIRIMLCEEFFNEIIWYKSLFFGSHALISRNEMNYIGDITHVVPLINLVSKEFSISIINELTEIIETKILNEHEMDIIEKFYDSTLDILEEIDLVPVLIRYMKVVNRIIARFEDIIVTILESDDTYLLSYTDLVNQVSHISVSEQTINYLNILGLYNNHLTLEVINKQYELGYILDYIYASVNNDININFSDENIILSIQDNCENIFNEYPLIWGKIRLSILQSFINNIDSYRFMFNADYPIINYAELSAIKDFEQSLSLINVQLVDDSYCDTLANYFNSFEKLRNSEIYSLFKFVLRLNDEYGFKMFYSIDAEVIPFNRLSKKNKKELVKSFNNMLNLDDSKGIIKFMSYTNELNETLEKKLWDLIKEDINTQNEYVKIINSINKLTPSTLINITNIAKINSIPIFTPQIEKNLYEARKYRYYVSSKVRREKKFIIEEDKIDILWNVYKDFMKADGLSNTKEIMVNNNDFMNRLVNEKVYVGLPEANRMYFARIPQTTDMLENLLLYGNDFQEKYLSVIVGFADKEAASKFVSILEDNEFLMISQNIYDNTYEKLIDSGLKYRYTRKRNKFESQKQMELLYSIYPMLKFTLIYF